MARICPQCGATIHSATNPTCYNCVRIEREEKRYGRRRPRASRRRPYAPATDFKALSPGTQAQPKQQTRPVEQVSPYAGVNRLLEDVYGRKRYLSDILQEGGISRSQLRQIRERYFDLFLEQLLKELGDWWRIILTWREARVLWNHYDMTEPGPFPSAKLTLAHAPLPWKQLQASALNRLRFPASVQELERRVVKAARAALGRIK